MPRQIAPHPRCAGIFPMVQGVAARRSAATPTIISGACPACDRIRPRSDAEHRSAVCCQSTCSPDVPPFFEPGHAARLLAWQGGGLVVSLSALCFCPTIGPATRQVA